MAGALSRSYRPPDRQSQVHWALLAATASIALHVALLWLLREARFFPAAPSPSRAIPFHLERVTFNSRSLEDPQDAESPQQNRSDNLLDSVIEPESARIPEEVLEPDFSQALVVDASIPSPLPGADQSAAPEALLNPDLPGMESPLESVAEFLRQAPVSESQPLISIDEADFEEALAPGDDGGLTDLLADAPAMDLPEGYADLDRILSGDGEELDPERPILMKTDLLFEFNRWTLKPTARISLMKLAMLIEQNPDTDFVIEGHTDTFGEDQYNLLLSERRAEAVRDWLKHNLLLEDDRITIRAFGKTRPIVNPAGNIAEQALNRRVEISMEKQ